MNFGQRNLVFFVISLTVLPSKLNSFNISSIFRKTFGGRVSQFSPSSFEVTGDSFSSPSSFDHFGKSEFDLVKQKKHNGDIQQLWDTDQLNGKMRNALKATSSNRWTDIRNSQGKYVIPFIISGQFTSQERQNIQKAMDAVAKNTCIQFRARNLNELDYVDIQNRRDEGCYTQVGRMRGRQVLMLESGWSKSCGIGCIQTFPGCAEYPTIVHELMHKIGLWHEHMRYDRDKHIKVHFENIPQEFHAQFRKIDEIDSTTYNVPYDFLSVMHYGKESGARQRGLTTMETLDSRYRDLIGTAKDASSSDYRKICAMYKCGRCMGKAFSPSSANWKSTSNNNKNSGSKPKKPRQPPKTVSPNCANGFLRPSKMFCSLIDASETPNLYKFLCC
uniref:Metalloendopeptidase n=1 Tax=Globodera rostochiensis TaxID=31243 RepID=A0A914I8G9_GLORO